MHLPPTVKQAETGWFRQTQKDCLDETTWFKEAVAAEELKIKQLASETCALRDLLSNHKRDHEQRVGRRMGTILQLQSHWKLLEERGLLEMEGKKLARKRGLCPNSEDLKRHEALHDELVKNRQRLEEQLESLRELWRQSAGELMATQRQGVLPAGVGNLTLRRELHRPFYLGSDQRKFCRADPDARRARAIEVVNARRGRLKTMSMFHKYHSQNCTHHCHADRHMHRNNSF